MPGFEAVEGNGNILLRNRFAHELIIEHSAAPIKDRYQKVAGAVMVFRDSTEARQMQRQLTYHASHDTLTSKVLGVPKRADVPHPIQEQLIIELCSK